METTSTYTIRDFLPLITIFSIIIILTGITNFVRGYTHWSESMSDFMGFFFILFGSFKVVNLYGFAHAYQMYDIIAKKSVFYAYAYPFIELALGIFYLARLFPFATNITTLIIMLVSSFGVGIELAKKKTITCACLGTLFKIPMTWVTLSEDLLMAAMALIMLIF